MSFSQITVHGHLGADPECKTNANGLQISEMRIAYDNGYKENAKTNWINVVAFGKTADFCNKYLQKGMAIIVLGSLNIDEYQNKEGVHCIKPRIHAQSVYSLSKRGDGSFNGGGGDGGQQRPPQQQQPGRPNNANPATGKAQPPGFGRPANAQRQQQPNNAMPPEFEPPDNDNAGDNNNPPF
ncbi:MAG: single-stranded DNA-binding protein [Fibrobacteraceae bacterium]